MMHLLNKASLSDVDLHAKLNSDNIHEINQVTNVPSAHFKGINTVYNAQNRETFGMRGHADNNVIDMSYATEKGTDF